MRSQLLLLCLFISIRSFNIWLNYIADNFWFTVDREYCLYRAQNLNFHVELGLPFRRALFQTFIKKPIDSYTEWPDSFSSPKLNFQTAFAGIHLLLSQLARFSIPPPFPKSIKHRMPNYVRLENQFPRDSSALN